MSTRKHESFNTKFLTLVVLITTVVAVAFIYFQFYYVGIVGSFLPVEGEELRAAFGSLGDAIGGIFNPVFSFLGILLLLFTLRQNQEALSNTADQLQVSQEELAETRKELAASAESQKDIAKTQAQQRSESSFYAMLEVHNRLQDRLHQLPQKRYEIDHMLSTSADDFISEIVRTYRKDSDQFVQLKMFNELRHVIAYLQYLIVFMTELDKADDNSELYFKIFKAQLTAKERLVILYSAAISDQLSFHDSLVKCVSAHALLEDKEIYDLYLMDARGSEMDPSHYLLVKAFITFGHEAFGNYQFPIYEDMKEVEGAKNC